jgi:hypothetical protein
MDYQKIYNNIIERGKNRILTGYKERHHIIPRCMGGANDTINLVFLTPEEHYVCHQLLVKLYPTNSSLAFSANMLTVPSRFVRRNNKAYGWLKRKFSENTSGDNHCLRKDSELREKNQEYMRGPKNPGKNQPKGKDHWKFGVPFNTSCFTEEGLKSMSESKIGGKNPMAGIKPWNHPRATEYTKGVWAKANEIRVIWEENNKPSYCKLYSLVNGKAVGKDWEAIGPYMNLVKYFRNGWIPTQDTEWINTQ